MHFYRRSINIKRSIFRTISSLKLNQMLNENSSESLSNSNLTSISNPSKSLTWYQTIRQFWIKGSDEEFEKAEKRVLSKVKTPFKQYFVNTQDGYRINTLELSHSYTRNNSQSLTNKQNNKETFPHPLPKLFENYPVYSRSPLVLIHGFAAGIGLWVQNFDHLSPYFTSIHAIDLIGHGRSSRPRFMAKTVKEAEAFFVESLENWRKQQNLDKITLLGHSFGGYVAATYTMKYPQNIDRLILYSPLGVPPQPEKDPRSESKRTFRQRIFFGFLNKVWEWGLTPQGAVKLAGPKGKQFIENYVNTRFRLEELHLESVTRSQSENENGNNSTFKIPEIKRSISEEEIESRSEAVLSSDMSAMLSSNENEGLDKPAVTEYLYQSFVQPASGEYALQVLLYPGAFARKPLIDRLPEVIKKFNIPTALIYGTMDWMSPSAGKQMCKLANQHRGTMLASCIRVKDSGHQLAIENRKGFAEAVLYSTIFDQLSPAEQNSYKQNFNKIYIEN